jgi:hypothetical protein
VRVVRCWIDDECARPAFPLAPFGADTGARHLHVAQLEIVPGSTYLFREPGALGALTQLTTAWIERHLAPQPERSRRDIAELATD